MYMKSINVFISMHSILIILANTFISIFPIPAHLVKFQVGLETSKDDGGGCEEERRNPRVDLDQPTPD